MNKKETAQIKLLDHCITLIQSGEATITDCLQTYPEVRSVLEPLILTAVQIHAGLSPASPREAYIKTTKIRILNRLQVLKMKPQITDKKPHRRRILIPKPVLTFLSLTLVLVMLLSGIGVTNASANALPGDTLYAVKRGVEELRLLLTIRAIEDAGLLTEFSSERLYEIEELIKSDPTQDIGFALQEYEEMLSRLLKIAQDEDILEDPAALEMINNGISNHEVVLQRVLDEAPLSAQKGLENALERSGHGKEVIQQIQEGGNPSDLAPGQQKKETEEESKPEDETRGPKPKDKTKGPKPKDGTPDPETD